MDAAVFDVDGTICFDGRSVSSSIVDALRTVQRRTRLVFASARPIRDLLPVLPEELHRTTLIGGNGAFARQGGELTVLGLSDADRSAIDALIEQHELRFLIDGDWDYSFTGDETHRIFGQLDAGRLARNVAREAIATYSKVVLFTDDPEIIDTVEQTGLSVTVHPDEGIVDIAPSGITKHRALNDLGITDGRYVAFGNDANDVVMLQRAGTSYGVGTHPALDFVDHRVDPGDVAAAIASLVQGD